MRAVKPHVVARAVERALALHVNPERRAFLEGGYAASDRRILGVAVPDLRAVVRRFSQELKNAPPRAVLAVAQTLVDDNTMEGRQAGYELVARRRDAMALLSPAVLRRLGRGNDNWASVDSFATTLVGPVWMAGQVPDRVVLGWARGRDRWWRRTALAATVVLNLPSRGGTGDARRTLAICRSVADDVDPMIAKALSWALRSLTPHDPEAVAAFLSRFQDVLPALVRREVTTKLATGRKTMRPV